MFYKCCSNEKLKNMFRDEMAFSAGSYIASAICIDKSEAFVALTHHHRKLPWPDI